MLAFCLVLGGCNQPAAPTVKEDARIDRAMVQVEAEQQRADQAELHRQAVAVAELARAPRTPLPLLPMPSRPHLATDADAPDRTIPAPSAPVVMEPSSR